jgi:gliding motility-associated-like protein
MIRKLLTILLFLPFGAFSQIQHIEVCTENQEYLQDYWIYSSTPSVYEWVVQGGLIVSGQGTDFITVNWLNIPYGIYNISVSVISDVGCIGDTSTLLVDVDECSFDGVYVPNCFTPNGDETNNVWGPVFSGDYIVNDFTLLIFNRWGNLIWESHHPDARWDGTFNGKMCQDGVYIWKMEYRRVYVVGNQIKHGHVTLLK